MDYYSILGVGKGATQQDIKKAYRKLAIEWHPDKNGGDKAAESKFKEISDAYNTLSDPNKKANYDNQNSQRHTNRSSDFGFNEFVKNQFRQGGFRKGPSYTDRPNPGPIVETDYLNITLERSIDLSSALAGIKLTIPVNRTICVESNDYSSSSKYKLDSEEKQIEIAIDLSNFYFNIKLEGNQYIINTRVAKLGNQDVTNAWNPEYGSFMETVISGHLYIKIIIDIPEDITLDGIDVIQKVKIPLSKAIFNGEKILIETILNKKYNAEINNPNSLSDLKFILKDKGIMGTDKKMGRYIIKFDIIPPSLDKLSKSNKETLKTILSEIE